MRCFCSCFSFHCRRCGVHRNPSRAIDSQLPSPCLLHPWLLSTHPPRSLQLLPQKQGDVAHLWWDNQSRSDLLVRHDRERHTKRVHKPSVSRVETNTWCPTCSSRLCLSWSVSPRTQRGNEKDEEQTKVMAAISRLLLEIFHIHLSQLLHAVSKGASIAKRTRTRLVFAQLCLEASLHGVCEVGSSHGKGVKNGKEKMKIEIQLRRPHDNVNRKFGWARTRDFSRKSWVSSRNIRVSSRKSKIDRDEFDFVVAMKMKIVFME